jgi:hypothetical protein
MQIAAGGNRKMRMSSAVDMRAREFQFRPTANAPVASRIDLIERALHIAHPRLAFRRRRKVLDAGPRNSGSTASSR